MLPKDKRLNLKKDFKRVASGRKIESKYLKLFLNEGDNTAPRIGIAISSKSFPKANMRNRARRLVSAAFQALYSQLPTNILIVALPKQGVIEVKSGDILSDLQEKLTNEKIIA